MADIFLRPVASDDTDIRLSDPTLPGGQAREIIGAITITVIPAAAMTKATVRRRRGGPRRARGVHYYVLPHRDLEPRKALPKPPPETRPFVPAPVPTIPVRGPVEEERRPEAEPVLAVAPHESLLDRAFGRYLATESARIPEPSLDTSDIDEVLDLLELAGHL